MGGLWVHVASVGEAQAALTMRPALEAQWGATSITWTTQTPAARALLLERTNGQVQPFFAPLDTQGAVHRFLQRVQPRMLILLERELWPEWLWQCEQRAVAVAVVNGRLKQRSTQRWPYSAQWMRQRLQSIQLALCADSGSARRFGQLGLAVARIHTTGNIKFDQSAQYDPPADLAAALAGRSVVVAASTHEADEDAMLAGWTHDQGVLLVIAPRHPQRFSTVEQRLRGMGLKPGHTLAIRSQGHTPGAHTQVLLLDTIGELVHLYPLATMCLMGGTWAPVGGHNALEPLAVGCPVLFGPHTEQFPDLYTAMAECGAARCVSAHELWPQVNHIVASRTQENGPHAQMQVAGLAFIASQQGSAARTINQLACLPCWPTEPMPEIAVSGNLHDTIWMNSALVDNLNRDAFDPAAFEQSGVAPKSLATGSGRGQAYKVEFEQQSWVLRHYRRGGQVAKWIGDTYTATLTPNSRAMQELILLRHMVSVGLAVPQPVAARCERIHPKRGRWSRYRADIAIQCIPNTRNLAQWLDTARPSPDLWQKIGMAVAQLHQHHIDHSDLNCHNILIDDKGCVWLVDFDKCSLRGGHSWKTKNLERLLRSLNKEQSRREGCHWTPEDWTHLLTAYQQTMFNSEANDSPKYNKSLQ